MIPSRTIHAESWPSVRASCSVVGACTAQYCTHSVRGFTHARPAPRSFLFQFQVEMSRWCGSRRARTAGSLLAGVVTVCLMLPSLVDRCLCAVHQGMRIQCRGRVFIVWCEWQRNPLLLPCHLPMQRIECDQAPDLRDSFLHPPILSLVSSWTTLTQVSSWSMFLQFPFVL
jgi:hypothetical protein